MVVTRSMSGTTKKADTKVAMNHKVAERSSKKTTAERASRQTRIKERALMASALSLFMKETFFKHFREKYADTKITSEVIDSGEQEWLSMTDSEKAPYIAKVEKKWAENLAHFEAHKQRTCGCF